MINDPTAGQFYGGQVAAPLFSTVMAGALRLMDIPPDNYEGLLAHAEAGSPGSEQ
jgi:cell division protein FtsI (penicillin-binding protein 3)